MNVSELIDIQILIIRKVFDRCVNNFANFKIEILPFLNLSQISEYTFIIDSFYLFEDTQLAKVNFVKFGTTGPTKLIDFGEVYLRTYGILNACYLQQQALFTCCDKLKLDVDKEAIYKLPIFDLRNTFAAHTPNRGNKPNIHSFILDRHALIEGKVKGYSSNAPSGTQYKEADLIPLLESWDNILVKQLFLITNYVLDTKRIGEEKIHDLINLREIFNRVKNVLDGNCFYIDIWADNPVCVSYKTEKC